jgi:2-C-methyl-D-erythritol 2,4-cyclodiphosphate synthase
VSDRAGVVATSDGDVLAHAVTDALLGACALGDMGDWFPSDDPASAGADSMRLLARVVSAGREAGWHTSHLDVTVIAEEIRVGPHRQAIRARLAEVIGIPVDRVSVKATTTDGLGPIGEGQGIAVAALITVEGVPAP